MPRQNSRKSQLRAIAGVASLGAAALLGSFAFPTAAAAPTSRSFELSEFPNTTSSVMQHVQRANVPIAYVRDLDKRDAYTVFKPADNVYLTKKPATPAGAQGLDFPIPGANGAQIFTFWSKGIPDNKVDSVLVAIHGKDRNPDYYYSTFSSILKKAVGYGSATPNTVIVAPLFFSTVNDEQAYSPNELGWADSNAWSSGDGSTHPLATSLLGPAVSPVSAFTVLDSLVEHFANAAQYPNMKYITVVGHGGGGQLATRHAALGNDNPAPNRISLRHVIGDPSSQLAVSTLLMLMWTFLMLIYRCCSRQFTEDRPTAVNDISCPLWDSYRYSLNNYSPGGAYPLAFGGDPVKLFKRFASRDVRYVIGAEDDKSNGDQSCMAAAWAGQERQMRNQAYFKYITLLSGGSLKSVSSFYGSFPALGTAADASVPQSQASVLAPFKGTNLQHKITFVAGAEHNVDQVYNSANGEQFLFGSLDALKNGSP